MHDEVIADKNAACEQKACDERAGADIASIGLTIRQPMQMYELTSQLSGCSLWTCCRDAEML